MQRIVSASFIALSLSCGFFDQKPKFANVAELLCEGLEDFEHLHNSVLSVHLLMERGDYVSALKVADELLISLDETKEVDGVRELRALIFLLESIVKGPRDLPH